MKFSQVGLLTFPITLAPAAQMLEHHLATTYEHLVQRRANGDVKGYTPIAEAESPRSGSALGVGLDRPQVEEGALPSPVKALDAGRKEPSVYTRCGNRLIMILLTTFIAAYIPCFGMVSGVLTSQTTFVVLALFLLFSL